MRLSTLFAAVASLASVWAADTDLKVVQAAFEKQGIPKALSIDFKPTVLLNVVFTESNTSKPLVVTAGDLLSTDVTTGPIRFALGIEDVSKFTAQRYVIISVDPDVPTAEDPSWGQIRHFAGGDFTHDHAAPSPPGVTIPLLANSTSAISDWVKPAPPPSPLGTPHRYIFLVYRQSKAFLRQSLVIPDTPLPMFDVAQFAKFTGLGHPIAGTFFLVKPPTALDD